MLQDPGAHGLSKLDEPGRSDSANALAPFADGSEKFLVGFGDGMIYKYDNEFTQLQGQGWGASVNVMSSFMYDGDVKVAIGLKNGAIMLYSEQDNVNGNNGITQLHDDGWGLPVTSMISFNYQGDTKLVVALGSKGYTTSSSKDVKWPVEMYSMKTGGWTKLCESSVITLNFFEYNGMPYIAAGMVSIQEKEVWKKSDRNSQSSHILPDSLGPQKHKDGDGGHFEIEKTYIPKGGEIQLYNVESQQWISMNNKWDFRITKLDVIGNSLLAVTENGELSSYPLSKIFLIIGIHS